MDLAERVIKPSIVRGVALYTALIGIAWCSLFPILWAVSGSLKNEGEVTRPKLFPSHPQWSNYREVFGVMPLFSIVQPVRRFNIIRPRTGFSQNNRRPR